jgi:hypothetical protein
MRGEVTGSVRRVLRLEGACLLLAAVFAYSRFGIGWGLFALLFFAPDIAFAAYWAGPRIGAIVYNALHSTVGPIALAMAASMPHARIPPALAILWLAHIGFDRALGYGLKYADGFVFTHLGNIGKQRQS